MAESFWEHEVVKDTVSEEQPHNENEQPPALAVSADDFAALEERIHRAVELVKRERQAGAAAEARVSEAEARAARAETHAQAQSLAVERLESELRVLRAEREQVRQRVERLLQQLDTLEV